MLLLLKLVLVPGLVAAVTLAGRRWGLRVAGIVTGLPLVAGPTFVFLAIEQGNGFAAEAARSAILGIVATTAFVVAYALSAMRVNWLSSVLAGWLAFAVTGSAIAALPRPGVIAELALAFAVLLGGQRLLRGPAAVRAAPPVVRFDLVVRMIAAAGAVVLFTALAEFVGPRVSGILSVFPIVTAILAAFTHVQRGPAATRIFLLGLLSGMYGLLLFCLVLSEALGGFRFPLLASMALALIAQMAVQTLFLWRLSNSARP